MSSAPSILIQVSSKHNFQRHIVEGYGFVKLPTAPGTYEFNVKTWVPKGGIRSEMRNYFIGGAYRLHNLKSIEMPGDMGGASFLSKFGFRTETSGTIKVRMNIIAQGPPIATGEEENGSTGGLGDSQTLLSTQRNNNLDSILNRVRGSVNARQNVRAGITPSADPSKTSPSRNKQQTFTFNDSSSSSNQSLVGGGATGGGGKSEKQDDLIKRTAKMFTTTLDAGRAQEVLDRIRQRKEARESQQRAGGGGGAGPERGGMNATA